MRAVEANMIHLLCMNRANSACCHFVATSISSSLVCDCTSDRKQGMTSSNHVVGLATILKYVQSFKCCQIWNKNVFMY